MHENLQDFVTFNEEILNGKLQLLCSVYFSQLDHQIIRFSDCAN